MEEQKSALFKVSNGLLWACTSNGTPLLNRIGQNLIPLCGEVGNGLDRESQSHNRRMDVRHIERQSAEVDKIPIPDILESRK